MVHIRVEQFNNIYARIICEDSTAMELSDFFTFTVPGAQFSPAFRKKHWDGKIRLFNIRTNQIYAGLVPHVVEFAKLNDYTVEDTTTYFGKSPVDANTDYGLPFAPRDYQEKAVRYALTKKRGIVISPTASGKSLIIYLIIRHMMDMGKQRGLLIVPTVSLVEQMYGDFKSYGWDAENHCQKIYQGREKEPFAPVVISTWQSIYDMPRKYYTKFDYVIGDEAHTFKAKSLTDIMTKLINCDYRVGTTGTLDDSKVNKLVLEGLFGPAKQIVSTKELIDKKHLADFKINCLVLKYPDAVCKHVRGMTYQEEIDFIVTYEERNKLIRDLAASLEGNTLILYTFVEKHGKVLNEMFLSKNYNRKIFFVHGGTDVLDREEIRHITEKEKDAIIVASFGTFSTGINIRNLHNIIFASPTKSRVRSLQSIGRGLRLGDDKTQAVLYDLADDLRYKSNVNFALKHFEERIKMYSEEKFPIKTQKVDLK